MVRKQTSSLERQLWGLSIGQGVIAILFGIVALFWPGLTVGLLLVFFGIFVLVWGITAIIVSLSTMGQNQFWWLELVFALLALGLAVYVLRNPVESATIFVFFIGVTFLVRGIVDVIEGLFDVRDRGDNRLFHVIVGGLGIAAGIITLVNPVTAGVAIVWIVGLYAVLYGAMSIAFAFRAQNELR